MHLSRLRLALASAALATLAACSSTSGDSGASASATPSKKVVIFVWDGLRPDSINATDTPNLMALRDSVGTDFTDNHSVYPSFTMMNASAFATGAYPGEHGFYGNTLYAPGLTGKDSGGNPAPSSGIVFTEDYGLINDLDSYYMDQLYLVGTLFQAAQKAGLKTAAVGKSGAAFIQDYADYASDTTNGNGSGVVLDEKFAFPLKFAQDLQAAGYVLPKNATVNYGNQLTLASNNGDPTAATGSAFVNLADGITPDPRSANGSPFSHANEYMMSVYLDYILPKVNPDLSLVWFRNPDSTEHIYGPGSPAYQDALRSQDGMLGQLMDTLARLKLSDTTDIIVVSDHGHSIVAGDPAFFPLHDLTGAPDGSGNVGTVNSGGYSVSGDVSTADLLTRAGIPHVYDGSGCSYEPVLGGIKADGSLVYPIQTDTDGSVCGTAGKKYSVKGYPVPSTLPGDAVVIAANGGSDYIYVPSHSASIVQSIVTVLQSRKQYGAILVADQYSSIPGTLSQTLNHDQNLTNGNTRNPDIIVSFDYDENAVTASSVNLPGTEYESFFTDRGMHGSYSPRDIHNTLIAGGPDFKVLADPCPSGNVDVAPTVAHILGLSLPQADGRPLLEAINGSDKSCSSSDFSTTTVSSTTATGLTILNPEDPAGGDVDKTVSSYQSTLHEKVLNAPDGKTYTYYDYAKAVRQ